MGNTYGVFEARRISSHKFHGGGEGSCGICRSSLGGVETLVDYRAMLSALEFRLKGYSYYLCNVLALEQGNDNHLY